MNITSAVFSRSAADLAACPVDAVPEVAFVGRSNVGKSSLVNLLTRNAGLARASATPGHTKLINFFTVNGTWRLVDLPGYGFAEVARKDSAQFSRAVAGYLQGRENLLCLFALIDSSLPPQDIDVEFIEWLGSVSARFVLVFTKTDRSSPATVQANVDAFLARLSTTFEKMPATFTCSATQRQGREELLQFIGSILPPEAKRPPVKQPPRRNTPW